MLSSAVKNAYEVHFKNLYDITSGVRQSPGSGLSLALKGTSTCRQQQIHRLQSESPSLQSGHVGSQVLADSRQALEPTDGTNDPEAFVNLGTTEVTSALTAHQEYNAAWRDWKMIPQSLCFCHLLDGRKINDCSVSSIASDFDDLWSVKWKQSEMLIPLLSF